MLVLTLVAGGFFVSYLWSATSPGVHPVLFGLVTCSLIIAGLAVTAAVGAGRQIRNLREETKRQERLNNTSLTRLQALWDQAPLSIMLFEPNDPKVPVKIVDCNPVACEIHGYRRE